MNNEAHNRSHNSEHHNKHDIDMSLKEFWDNKYAEKERFWSGKPNATLVRHIENLSPGSALELGCGEGADAIWLALHGWNVTACDVSEVALERAQKAAEQAGIEDQISFEQHDFNESFPEKTYDLVTSLFLRSPVKYDRTHLLAQAARAVSSHGHLLIVDHGSAPPWSNHQDMSFPNAQETYNSLPHCDEFSPIVIDSIDRETKDPDGNPVILDDVIVFIQHK